MKTQRPASVIYRNELQRDRRVRPLCWLCGRFEAAALLGLSICVKCAGLVK